MKGAAVLFAVASVASAQVPHELRPDLPVRQVRGRIPACSHCWPLSAAPAAVQEVAARSCNYYNVEKPESGNSFNLSVTVSPLDGDVDLFMNCGPSLPSQSDYIWRSIHWGADSIDVYSDDSSFCGSRFVVAACGFTNSTYVIEADIHESAAAPPRAVRAPR